MIWIYFSFLIQFEIYNYIIEFQFRRLLFANWGKKWFIFEFGLWTLWCTNFQGCSLFSIEMNYSIFNGTEFNDWAKSMCYFIYLFVVVFYHTSLVHQMACLPGFSLKQTYILFPLIYNKLKRNEELEILLSGKNAKLRI